MPVYQAVAQAVGRGLGMSTVLTAETDYEACLEDRHDVYFICGLPYVLFAREGAWPAVPIVAPVVAGERYGGEPVYFSDVIVRRDSPLQSFPELRGQSWAYNEPLSQSGYGITRHHLLGLGETDGFFGSVVESGYHEESIRMVQVGEVDASAVDSHLLDVELRNKPELRSSLRIIDTIGPSTIQPIAVSPRIGSDLRWEIREVLLRLHLDPVTRPLLDFGGIDHFTAVGPESYDDVRLMLEACEAAGFMHLR